MSGYFPNDCRKCRMGSMRGPTYSRSGPMGAWAEALIYRCDRCGFEERRPTADANSGSSPSPDAGERR